MEIVPGALRIVYALLALAWGPMSGPQTPSK